MPTGYHACSLYKVARFKPNTPNLLAQDSPAISNLMHIAVPIHAGAQKHGMRVS